MKPKTTKMIKTGTALLLSFMMVASMIACTSTSTDSQGKESTSADLATQAQQKYAQESAYEYASPIYNVPRDYQFTFKLGFDPVEAGFDSVDQIIGVYTSDSFSLQVSTQHNETPLDDGGVEMTVFPYKYPAARISSATEIVGEGAGKIGDGAYLFDRGEGNDWGNLPQYYMVQWVDLETGEKLAKPIVTVFTVQCELETPTCSFSLNENGEATFSWNEIEGATKYYIVRDQVFADSSYAGPVTIVGETTDTTWSCPSSLYSTGNGAQNASIMNALFENYTIADDALNSAYSAEYQSYEPIFTTEYSTHYGVIAVNEEGSSAESNLCDLTDIDSLLPNTIASYTARGNETYTSRPISIGFMPAQVPITMCDGSTVYYPINYDIDNAEVRDVIWGEMADDGTVTPYNTSVVVVSYTVYGTDFTGECQIENYDEGTWKQDLANVQTRQQALMVVAGTTNETTISTETSDSSGSTDATSGTDSSANNTDSSSGGSSTVTVTTSDDEVFATNALSDYLAAMMLDGQTTIPLGDFAQASDPTYLADAWAEAYYQNPLILGVSDVSYDAAQNTLLITYEEDADSQAAKQDEIRSTATRIIDQIITDDMTDLEKEMAINDYLCENAEYDYDALDNGGWYRKTAPNDADGGTGCIPLGKRSELSSYISDMTGVVPP